MSLLPRRGPGRHEQPGHVAVHPGWTLAPTAVNEPGPPRAGSATVTEVPASRWTSHPPLPSQPAPAPSPAPVAQATPAIPASAAPTASTAVPSPLPAEVAVVPTEPLASPVVREVAAPDVAGADAAAPDAAAPDAVVPPASSVPTLPEPVRVPAHSWNQDWAAVAATRAPADSPMTLHSAAVAAIDAVFGAGPSAQAAWTAAPAGLQPQPHPAPLPPQVLTAPAPAPSTTAPAEPVAPAERLADPLLSALDRPLAATETLADTPLAAAAAWAATPLARAAVPPYIPPAAPLVASVAAPVAPTAGPSVAPTPAPSVVPPSESVVDRPASAVAPPAAPVSVNPAIPAPPPTPQGRMVVPSAAQQLVEHAMRTAPTMPPPRRSTVRLGFADASVIDLRADDPIARALHTVADALLSRDRA